MTALYVDDMLVCSTSNEFIDKLRLRLRQKFGGITEKTGDTISFLGLEICRQKGKGVKVNQSYYVNEFLKEFEVEGTVVTPTDGNFMSVDTGEACEQVDSTSYRSMVMKVMYVATRTRPDVLYCIGVLATRCNKPTRGDMHRLRRILKYLAGTVDNGLIFYKDGDVNLHMYVDASFNHHWDARGHTGFMIFGDGSDSAALMCKSNKQTSVAGSSCEAELMAMSEGVQWLTYISGVFSDCGILVDTPVVFEDNTAVIQLLSEDPVNFRGRSKFINRQYFTVHEKLANNEMKIVFVGTMDMVADFLTKGLQGNQFRKFAIRCLGGKCE